ncbi:hypothetical protein GUJ93_ZPchr0004g39424 [Zizania palustris]|uniref:Uncharacterized protein n=1 Tax=Zizania palustris TaxID=103762 RepID=A0A8J5VGU1_ZIZPA|nr:hypothetical protein GUJ93_ZPchr0004g39424 [Zizania palustris]
MGQLRRCIAIALLVVFVHLTATFAVRCDGARSMQITSYVKPPAMSTGRFFGHLPRAKLIPPSGPSERHNAIEPETEGQLISKP